jgi:aspartate-semialdehyde dehydrogenase
LDILGNVVPYIRSEEDKVETEPLKMLGALKEGRIVDVPATISAQCNRVAVRDGHMGCVSAAFGRTPEVEAVVAALEAFRAPPEVAALPSSPARPVVIRPEPDRPQPILDRDAGRGNSITVGRVRPCPLLDVKFVFLGHNTLRGAAGGAIHNAELLVAQGWIAR